MPYTKTKLLIAIEFDPRICELTIWLLGGFLLFDEAALGRFAPTRGRFEI